MKQVKKGFTLIELLAVIVILAIIALIAVPVVMNIISKANKSAFKDSAYGIIKAGELYYADHLLEVNGMENDEEFIFPDNIGNLQIKGSMPSSGNMIVSRRGQVAIAISNGKYCVRKGYTDNDVTMDEDIKNCKTKEIMNPISVTDINISEENITLSIEEEKVVTVTVEPSNATIKTLKWSSLDESIAIVDNNGKVIAKKEGSTTIKVETTDGSNINKIINVTIKEPLMISTNSCIKNNTICPNGTKVNIKVNLSDNYDFYVINDTKADLTLIMDRNLGDRIEWISESDFIAVGGNNFGNNGSSYKGPLTALKVLEERTSSWSNIKAMTYTLTDDGGGNKYFSITRTNVRARILKYTEAMALGCTGSSYGCPNYLYTNTNPNNSNTEYPPYGYWLSSAFPYSTYSGWTLISSGNVGNSTVNNVAISFGVRPVITISKDL